MSDLAPTSAPSKKSRSGISWMGWNCSPGVSSLGQFKFFSVGLFFWVHNLFFFSHNPWPQVFFGTSYLHLQPTNPSSPHPPPLLHSLHCQQVEHLGLGAWSFRSFRNESSISYFKVSTSQFSFVPFASPSFLLPPHCTKTDKALVVFVLVLVPPQRHQAKLIVSFFLFWLHFASTLHINNELSSSSLFFFVPSASPKTTHCLFFFCS